MAPKKNASKPRQRPNPPRATASGRISKPRRRLGENPPPPVAAAIPEEDQWDEEEPVEDAYPVPAAMASLEQLRQFEASIDERFEQLDANFQASHHDIETMIDNKFSQLLEHLNNLQAQFGLAGPAGVNPLSGLGISGTLPLISDDVLSRWFWLDKAIIETIDLSTFDINQLLKLQREESA